MKTRNSISIDKFLIVCGYSLITLALLSLLAKIIINL